MRFRHSNQSRLDCQSIEEVELNLNCRDEMIPILFSLRYIYQQPQLRDAILDLIEQDVNGDSRSDRGRTGFTYWQILVLAAVRLGCDFDYDRLQDLAENHRALRHMMQIGDWDDRTSFSWKRIWENITRLRPQTIAGISNTIAEAGRQLHPEAAQKVRADSFVVETNIHYPTESSLICDGLRVVIRRSAALAEDLDVSGWRQHTHLYKKVKNLNQAIARLKHKKGAPEKRKALYAKLLERAARILEKAEDIAARVKPGCLLTAALAQEITTFIERTRQVMDTAQRRVIEGQRVPNEDKLFSVFEPHTQLYKRGKAGQEIQYGRLLLIFEDALGFTIGRKFMTRNEADSDVVVEETRKLQTRLDGAIEELSLDRGFFSAANQRSLEQIVPRVCLPKKHPTSYANQLEHADENFHQQRKRHAGVESSINALQSGNGLKRCRDRSERGQERYIELGILGRNLHILGKLLIAQQAPDAPAAASLRQAA